MDIASEKPKTPSAGGMIHKGHIFKATEVWDAAVTVWQIFGLFWQLVLWSKASVPAGFNSSLEKIQSIFPLANVQ